jgi:pancreatic triacylglycerol lipase
VENCLLIYFYVSVYVEIIHTNGGTLGFGKPLGQADFYPNYGRWQPGCGWEITGSCSHARAPEIFAESINHNGFVAQRCASFEEVNKDRCTSEDERFIMRPEPANYGLRGVFYLTTNSKSLFGTGK